MASTGIIWATSQRNGDAAILGAPDGVFGSWVVAVFSGVQSAIGASPLSIDSFTVTVVSATGPLAVSGYVYFRDAGVNTILSAHPTASGTPTQTATYTSPLPTWAQLADGCSATYSGGGDFGIDAVGVTVGYTPATLSASGTSAAVSTATATATYIDTGAASGTSAAVSTATATADLTSPSSGSAQASSTATATADLTSPSSGRVAAVSTVSGALIVPTLLLPTPRTLDQLIAGSAQIEDHVIVTTGPHAGGRLPVISASLTLDSTADIRAQGEITVDATIQWAVNVLDPRTKTELAVIIGVRGDDGTPYTWQKALLHPVSISRSQSTKDNVKASAKLADRADWVRKAGMREPLLATAGTSIATAVASTIYSRAPWLPRRIMDPGYLLTADATIGALGGDAWKEATTLSGQLGQELYVDELGVACCQPITDVLATSPAALWIEGPNCRISDMDTTLDDSAVVNVIGVTWQTQATDDTTATGGTEFWEDHSSSVSIEAIGERVKAYSADSSTITSAPQAADVARSQGLIQQGIALATKATVKTDPRLSVGDVVQITRTALGIDWTARITGISLTAGSPTMDVTLGARRLT